MYYFACSQQHMKTIHLASGLREKTILNGLRFVETHRWSLLHMNREYTFLTAEKPISSHRGSNYLTVIYDTERCSYFIKSINQRCPVLQIHIDDRERDIKYNPKVKCVWIKTIAQHKQMVCLPLKTPKRLGFAVEING